MAIKPYTRDPESKEFNCEFIEYDGFAFEWVIENIHDGENFLVFDGDEEISRDLERMKVVRDVSVFIVPADAITAAYAIVALVVAAVVVLQPEPKPLGNVNRNQQSPNNALSDRRNVARPNERIVDICGKVKSIPDTIQPEWARYDSNGVEVRTGAYCIGRKQVQVEDIKDGDTLFTDSEQSAGVYYPFKSPNNSSPDIQVGDPIDEPIVGVLESSDAIDQTMIAPNEKVLEIDDTYTVRRPTVGGDSVGEIRNPFGGIGSFAIGDLVNIIDLFIDLNPEGEPNLVQIGANTHEIVGRTDDRLYFNIDSDPSWLQIPFANYPVDTTTSSPKIEAQDTTITVGPFTISSTKIDRLIFNAYAPNGFYKDGGSGKQLADVDFKVIYQKLNDNLDPIGPETPVIGNLQGATSNAIGSTIDVDLGGLTYIKWRAERITDKDFDFSGQVVDEIKIKSVFGLYDIDRENFGDITMIQTQRKALAKTVLIKTPEVNCIATEMVNKYQGSGVFDPVLTPNTQGMQSLIRLALDDRIGRRAESELDLDLLLSIQTEIETYFQSAEAGSFNYSFDSTNTTAQETFFTVANAIFCILWREGRVLKAFFEKPQTIPQMVFTHRSKKGNSETWTREFSKKKRKDSIEFVYTDEQLYTQETLYFPEDRSGKNPKKFEIPGIKGKSQATWRALREFNKLKYQEISVDFTATAEGRFVKPQRMISVVKGSRVHSFDGYIRAQDGLQIELSQDVEFTPGDDHTIILKQREGGTESIPVFEVAGKTRVVQLGFLPVEPIYTANSELKTEFSFGNEARLSGQLIIPQEINPSDKQYVGIKGINYSDMYYDGDPIQPIKGGFSSGFSDGFF